MKRFRAKLKFELYHNLCDPKSLYSKVCTCQDRALNYLWSPFLLYINPILPLSQWLKPSVEKGKALGHAGMNESTKTTTVLYYFSHISKMFYFSQLFQFRYFKILVLFLGWCYQHQLWVTLLMPYSLLEKIKQKKKTNTNTKISGACLHESSNVGQKGRRRTNVPWSLTTFREHAHFHSAIVYTHMLLCEKGLGSFIGWSWARIGVGFKSHTSVLPSQG